MAGEDPGFRRKVDKSVLDARLARGTKLRQGVISRSHPEPPHDVGVSCQLYSSGATSLVHIFGTYQTAPAAGTSLFVKEVHPAFDIPVANTMAIRYNGGPRLISIRYDGNLLTVSGANLQLVIAGFGVRSGAMPVNTNGSPLYFQGICTSQLTFTRNFTFVHNFEVQDDDWIVPMFACFGSPTHSYTNSVSVTIRTIRETGT